MKTINLVDAPNPWEAVSENACVYDSPSLKIQSCRIDPGQSLLMSSDDMRGRVCLLVIDGQGECVVDENGRYPVQTGDIVISETSEAHRLLALTDLHLLVTFASADCTCPEGAQRRAGAVPPSP
jgi:quercetin dioxygenase-like cupin family protein